MDLDFFQIHEDSICNQMLLISLKSFVIVSSKLHLFFAILFVCDLFALLWVASKAFSIGYFG